MKIYVANLSAYVNGVLLGEWIDLLTTSYDDFKELLVSIECMDEEHNLIAEYAIHDYSSSLGICLGEYDDVAHLYELAERVSELDDTDLLEGLIEIYGDLETALDKMEHVSYCEADNCASLGEYCAMEFGDLLQIPEKYRHYFDYEKYGRDISFEGTFTSNGLFIWH